MQRSLPAEYRAHGAAGRQQRHQHAGRDRDQHHVVNERPEQVLADDLERPAREPQRIGHRGEVTAQQRERARRHRHVGTARHGQPHVGARQGGCVIQAVAHHGDPVAALLQPLDGGAFFGGGHAGEDMIRGDPGL